MAGNQKPCQDTLNAVNTKLRHSAHIFSVAVLTPVNPHVLIASHAITPHRLLGCLLTLLLGFSAAAQTPVRKIAQHFLPTQPIYDVWGYTDELTGKEYALCGSGGLVIFDVTDRHNPVLVANIESDADFDVKVWGHHAYTVTGGGGQDEGDIIDLSQPENPVVVGHFPSAHNLFIDEQGYMYASFPSLIIYDLNPDPANPQQVWIDHTGGGGHDVMVKNDMLYDFHGYEGTFIYEASDRANPVLLAHIDDPAISYNHGGDVTADGNTLYICDELARNNRPDVTTWDISDLNNISRIDQITDSTATMHNFYIIGDYAYTSHYSGGFRIYDITDRYNLKLVTEYDTSPHEEEGFIGAFGIYPWFGLDRILITDRDSGLMILSITDQDLDDQNLTNQIGPNTITVFPNPASGSFRVLASGDGMRDAEVTVYDVAGKLMAYRRTTELAGFVGVSFHADEVPPGVYMVVVEYGTGRHTARVVVE